MRRFSYFILTLIFLFACSGEVKAARGDLNYEITSVIANNDNVVISGYAFIHKTNNYVTVYKRNADGTVTDEIVNVSDGDKGGQKVKIRVSQEDNNDNYLDFVYNCVDDNYNFYYQMFYKDSCATSGSLFYDYTTYNNANYNVCSGGDNKPCYYEDLGFTIKISIEELLNKFSSDSKLSFYIAASNNDYGQWTTLKELKIPQIVNNSDYVEIVGGEYRNGVVKFIANEAVFRNIGFGGGFNAKTRTNYNIVNYNEGGFNAGTKLSTDINRDISVYCSYNGINRVTHFLNGTIGPRLYALCSYDYGSNACKTTDENGYCSECQGKIVGAFGSWITLTGSNQLVIKLKKANLCEVTIPSNDTLNCNGSKSYNSTCEELIVSTSEGSARVKIEQKGTVSSVLTPDSIYAGGGFNFGIMYYNTVKWSYVSGQNIGSDLDKAVTRAMNNKIKDYDLYVAGINIVNLKLGGKSFSLVKQCTTSNSNKDYYNKELTVSCLFTIPKSDIDQIGNVNYIYDASSININNKYYTPINYEGEYKITADIVGMDRITKNASEGDSKENGKGWTGDWSDTFTNCQIDVYGLLTNFIYRPIDIFDPFPNRNAGINWFDWYNLTRNKERLENTYSDIDYTVMLDNKAIVDIKNYNSSHNYLEWDSIDEVTNESSFITGNNYIVRGGN